MTFEQEIEKEAENCRCVCERKYICMCDSLFTDGATIGRELTLKELGVSDPKEVMSRFLHEQRMAHQIEVCRLQNEIIEKLNAETKELVEALEEASHYLYRIWILNEGFEEDFIPSAEKISFEGYGKADQALKNFKGGENV